ncbi:hypothetical protein LOD99_1581 [Oopsacas minuta]|uniref:Uncharacterized protein n=1 Tax=Oopsacas minuta TaxID=111878 RepID=A0AAV7K3M4_9METZ|nr:hypothetical protein LOD99_1581 [Oopsacas minuta]
MNNIKFVLVGDHNCGMNSLRMMLEQTGSSSINEECLKGEILDAKTKFIKLLQDRSNHTVFLIVIPITLRVLKVQWLDSLKAECNHFRNAIIVFTHTNTVNQTHENDLLEQHVKEICKSKEWDYLLRCVNGRFVCLNSISQELEYKRKVVKEIIRISKPSYTILIHGNNHASSSIISKKLQLSDCNNVIELKDIRMNFYFYPDLDLFQGLQQPDCGDCISNLIGNRVHHGQGITLILLLVSHEEILSRDMKEMITDLPHNEHYRMDHKTDKYWWNHTSVLFTFGENSNNCRDEVMNSIKRNVRINEVVNRAGGRYIWMSDTTSKEDIVNQIRTQCDNMKKYRNGREFIGGPTKDYPMKMKEEKSNIPEVQHDGFGGHSDILFNFISFSNNSKSNTKFVLVGDHNCGVNSLRMMLEQTGSSSINEECLKGEILDAKTKFIKLLQDRSNHTVFLIVIPITLIVLKVQWLDSLKAECNNLALSSVNLFRNAIIVFTHTNTVNQTHENNLLEQHVKEMCKSKEWDYLLRCVNGRFVCLNSILQELEYRRKVVKEIIQFSKPSYTILIHGNNHANSSILFTKLQLSDRNNVIELEDIRMNFYSYPDFDLFQGLQQPDCGDVIRNLIGNRVYHGQGLTLILLLISQQEIFSRGMREMITDLPHNEHYRMDHKTDKYWWNHTSVLFTFGENSNNFRDEVLNSIKRNVRIKEVVNRAGGRYIWMSDTTSKEDIVNQIQTQCDNMKKYRNGREFIGGPTKDYPMKMNNAGGGHSLYKFV